MKKAIETIDLAKLNTVLGGCGQGGQRPPQGGPQGGQQQQRGQGGPQGGPQGGM
jgi:hypothetical protein